MVYQYSHAIVAERAWRPTLRTRLALWTGGLLLASAVGLTLFINVATTVISSATHTVAVPEVEVPPVEAVIPAAPPSVERLPSGAGQPEATSSDVLRSMRFVSLIGVAGIAILGAAGAYWLAGRALYPLRQMSRAAQGIDAASLDRRLASDGPDDELKELADAFNAMLVRLERAFTQQRRFVSDAAHELRTPLATLRANVEAALSDATRTAEDCRDEAEASERSLTRLESLIADLLILATEDRAPCGEEIAMGPLLEDVLLDLRPVATERAVSLHIVGEAEVTVRGEESLLRRVFHNLVENAIHYNRAGGRVKLTVQEENGWAIVKIADTGMGMSAREQAHIFERFYRGGGSRAQHRDGVGLGLAIVADIIRRHGGTIETESVPGIGSTFTVRLPV